MYRIGSFISTVVHTAINRWVDSMHTCFWTARGVGHRTMTKKKANQIELALGKESHTLTGSSESIGTFLKIQLACFITHP